ncbi:ferritin-like domain-containing protein [Nannocystis sp. ILAH1]|uniref:ferritin-like domain-containing protein n=1 Tax=Nannocystis sp. ILAH1 TaxID=2996789 RepID=UPI00226EC012|nr:ferritin-like domain-containing protein [Nannocystis sp. ILAH1]MCY0992199.1 ferritin-like domain-containing protein [Nannocystis sp. ILAH1]
MLGDRRLSLLFASLLAEVTASGCGADDPCTYEQVTAIGANRLAPYIEDGNLTLAECQVLCPMNPAPPPSAVPDEPSSTSSSTSTTGDTTSDPTSTTGAVDDDNAPRTSTVLGCAAIPASKSDIRCQYETSCKGGRRPAGLCSEGRSGGDDPIARWFAEVAHLEAASVPAFERLAAELREHDAPADLIAAALRAAVDEARHADHLGAIAIRLGGRPSPVELAPTHSRSLVELAIENAVEGCVGETWAALLAAHQARAAEDPEIRACMIEVAADEAAHADLAWAIDAWIAPLLTADERTRLLTARSQAARALRDPPPRDEALERRAGLPAPDLARRLWKTLDRELWSAAA